jgi:hypothetical protein
MSQSNIPGQPDAPAAPDGDAPATEEADNQIEAHPDVSFQVAVAPNDLGDTDVFNTLRPGLRTVACWRLDDTRFAFDSAFIKPETRADITRLAVMEDDYPDCPMSIWGHADPEGTDDYNKKLSGERAKATYALLTRNKDMWEELFKNELSVSQSILIFLEDRDLEALPEAERAAAPRFPGPADGKDTKAWRDAVRRFQESRRLKVDGDPGPDTRKALYTEYMKVLCTNEEGKEFELKKEQFLGKGADAKGKADFQGCSEFNPVFLLSKDERDELTKNDQKDERNRLNAPNRRVVLFFFPPKLEIDVQKWPCPRASEGRTGCVKRFWTDHELRRKPKQTERRSYGPFTEEPKADDPEADPTTGRLEGTRDTFACRFYDRLARHSPCEAGFQEWIVQLLGPEGEPARKEESAEAGGGAGAAAGGEAGAGAGSEAGGEASEKKEVDRAISARPRMAGIRFEARAGARVTRGQTDANGVARIRARAKSETIRLTLTIPLEPEPGSDQVRETSVVLTLKGGELEEIGAGKAIEDRLHNLGFGPVDLGAFRGDATKIDEEFTRFASENGATDADREKVLKKSYGS